MVIAWAFTCSVLISKKHPINSSNFEFIGFWVYNRLQFQFKRLRKAQKIIHKRRIFDHPYSTNPSFINRKNSYIISRMQLSSLKSHKSYSGICFQLNEPPDYNGDGTASQNFRNGAQ